MVTSPTVSKPPSSETYEELMHRASISTSNLGWLQDYTRDWQTLRSVAIRIGATQRQQTSIDEQAATLLAELVDFATAKCEQLEEAYTARYSQHERLMIRLENERRD